MKYFTALLISVLLLLACLKTVPGEEELFSEAQELETAQEFSKAAKIYETIAEKYPDSPNRYQAIFMIGFIHLEHLKDNKRAVSAFDKLLAEYPECDLADDAIVLRDIAEKGTDIMSTFEDSAETK